MRRYRLAWILLAGAALAAAPASAQTKGQVGVAMGYPASVDLVWHVSDWWAVRPELTFGTSSGDATSTGQTLASNVDGWTVGVAVGVLIYATRPSEGLRPYVSPRGAWSRSTTSTGGGAVSDSTNTTYSLSLSFGAQYALGRHFAVFGEVGYAYTHADTVYTSGATRTDSLTRTTAPRTAVGVVVYF